MFRHCLFLSLTLCPPHQQQEPYKIDMAITPAPGYQVDPNNPNGVIPIGSAAETQKLGVYNTGGAPTATPSPQPLKSSFSSSAMPAMQQSASTAQASAQTAINPAPTKPPAQTFNAGVQQNGQPLVLDYNALPKGYSTTPPTGRVAYTTHVTQWGPVYQSLEAPATPVTTNLPQGYTAGTPDQNGNVPVTTPGGNTVSYNPSALTAQTGVSESNYLSNFDALHASLQSSGTQYTVNSNGDISINDPAGGGPITISAYSIANDPSEALNTVNSYKNTVGAINEQTTTQLNTLKQQYDENLQQLNEQEATAQEQERAAMGKNGGEAGEGATGYFATLKANLYNDYQTQVAAVQSQSKTAIAGANSQMSSDLSKISENAKQTIISTQQQNFANAQDVIKTIDFTGLNGTGINSLSIGANGTTGNAAVDSAIATLTKVPGTTPQAALQLLQLGTSTQQKSNASTVLSLLNQLSYTRGWNQMTPDQLKQDPLFATAQQMVQSAIGAFTPEAAASFVQGGTLAQQKLAAQLTGSPTGVSPGLTGGQGGGAIGTIAPGMTADPNYVIPGTGGVLQSAIDRAAQIMNATGKSATAVYGSSFGGSAIQKQNILNALNNRASQLVPNGLSVVQSEQLLKGAGTTLTTASRLKATVDASIVNVTYSARLLLGDGTTANPGLVSQVNFGTDVIWNQAQGRYVMNLGAGSTPERQATVGKYVQALNAITYEYGKIVYGNGTATFASTEDAANAINGYLSSYSQTQVINQVLGEIQARKDGIQSVIDGTSQQILNGVTTDSNGATILPTVVDPAEYAQQQSQGNSSDLTQHGYTKNPDGTYTKNGLTYKQNSDGTWDDVTSSSFYNQPRTGGTSGGAIGDSSNAWPGL